MVLYILIMKAKEVLNILNISRVTLHNYVKNGKLKATKLANGYYNYDNKSVMLLAGKDKRKNVIYARVSTYKQKKDLKNQIEYNKKYCKKNNITIDYTVSDISSGLDLNRKHFSDLLDDILDFKINIIVVSHKDRLTRLSFKILRQIFKKFGTIIVIANKHTVYGDNEYFDDLITLIHTFSTKMYSRRRVKNIKNT